MGDEVAVEAVAAMDELGLDGWILVEHDGDVVSCSNLLAEAWELAGTTFAVGMPDFVATRSAHEGRGLFRHQIEVHHARSLERGDPVQAIIGIPYYYRRFGYSYPLPSQHALPLRQRPTAVPDGITVRDLTLDDLPAVEALQTQALAAADLRMRHRTATWRCMLACTHLRLVVAEREGQVVGCARLYHDGDAMHVLDLAGDEDALEALLATAHEDVDDLFVQRRPDPTVLARLADGPTRDHASIFVRVPDLVRILDLLRPVLSERLRSGQLRHVPSSVVVSRYTDAAELEIRDRTITAVRPAPATRYTTPGVMRVPPDEIPALLFGPHGAAGMEERHPDVLLGDVRDLADLLFPPVTADLLTWVPPY